MYTNNNTLLHFQYIEEFVSTCLLHKHFNKTHITGSTKENKGLTNVFNPIHVNHIFFLVFATSSLCEKFYHENKLNNLACYIFECLLV